MLAEPDDTSLAFRILADEPASVPVGVAPLERPSLLWAGANGLTQAEAADVAVCIGEGATERAWADRYGGVGIGGNGGSGRAGFYRGYYLKGIGPTPLIGRTTNRYHLSGGAYLEEAVRETIFAELFAFELPWGAVRTKAIVDTLEDQYWVPDPESDLVIEFERRVLLVREPLFRLAHLQRANYFTGDEALTGASDMNRVARNRQALVDEFGADHVEERLRQFWMRWCDQCAYLYAARLTQGAPSTSNIALDGRLLDFGAASSLPDWCASVVFPGEPENGFEFPQLAQFLNGFYAEHQDGLLTKAESSSDYAASLLAKCETRYLRTVGLEMLRLAGLRRATIEAAISDRNKNDRLASAAMTAMKRYLRKFRPTIEGDEASELWDFPSFWEDRPPVHLGPLRTIADEIARTACGEPIRERMQVRCAPRRQIFRESLRRRLHRELPKPEADAPADGRLVTDIIRREVTNARRDTRWEPPFDHPCGFAAAGTTSYALFRQADGGIYAIEESLGGSRFEDPSSDGDRNLRFDDGSIAGTSMDVVHLI